MNISFKSQFSYCLLVSMCHSCLIDKNIDRPHQRCLRFIYIDKTLSFLNLLVKDGSATIHTRYLQVIPAEMFEIHKNMLAELMQRLALGKPIIV